MQGQQPGGAGPPGGPGQQQPGGMLPQQQQQAVLLQQLLAAQQRGNLQGMNPMQMLQMQQGMAQQQQQGMARPPAGMLGGLNQGLPANLAANPAAMQLLLRQQQIKQQQIKQQQIKQQQSSGGGMAPQMQAGQQPGQQQQQQQQQQQGPPRVLTPGPGVTGGPRPPAGLIPLAPNVPPTALAQQQASALNPSAVKEGLIAQALQRECERQRDSAPRLIAEAPQALAAAGIAMRPGAVMTQAQCNVLRAQIMTFKQLRGQMKASATGSCGVADPDERERRLGELRPPPLPEAVMKLVPAQRMMSGVYDDEALNEVSMQTAAQFDQQVLSIQQQQRQAQQAQLLQAQAQLAAQQQAAQQAAAAKQAQQAAAAAAAQQAPTGPKKRGPKPKAERERLAALAAQQQQQQQATAAAAAAAAVASAQGQPGGPAPAGGQLQQQASEPKEPQVPVHPPLTPQQQPAPAAVTQVPVDPEKRDKRPMVTLYAPHDEIIQQQLAGRVRVVFRLGWGVVGECCGWCHLL
jgi:hypothetical protein